MTSETLAQRAYSQIKQDILEGRIDVATPLSERLLAAQTGVSRIPLRNALARLEYEGLLSRVVNGGLMVQPVTMEQLLEIVQMRRLLEGAAAERAAGREITRALEDSRRVMSAYAAGAETAFDDFWIHDDQFHDAVARAAGLTLLPAILAEQRAIARRCTITRTHDSFTEQAREHLAVIDAITTGDGPAARAAMELHFDNVRARFLHWLGR
ncbi:GntR family transcriptional regulator [Pseudooceanicola sp. GBMRC 2024]|uniref:GntR family transcriptional regulator n=1 Tax=Pseudooceanicola albus TaxID=2692189 RepID=A0A6L7G2T3_9RHOB|nr:GntR family transcriptional regulator [Pseudooceanicola albus]MXN17746.1 GntR family transcriptional regulator [Pseudooceanicola albus]